ARRPRTRIVSNGSCCRRPTICSARVASPADRRRGTQESLGSPALGGHPRSHDITAAWHLVSQHDLHIVRAAVIEQWNRGGIDRGAVQGGFLHPSAPAGGVGHRDVVAAVEELPRNLVLGPGRGNARVDGEHVAPSAKTENALEAGTIHPAGRS